MAVRAGGEVVTVRTGFLRLLSDQIHVSRVQTGVDTLAKQMAVVAVGQTAVVAGMNIVATATAGAQRDYRQIVVTALRDVKPCVEYAGVLVGSAIQEISW